MKKRTSSVYLVSQYLLLNKKCYIHIMKKECKANNIGQRISVLRNTHNWDIETIEEKVVDGVRICYYKLIQTGKRIRQYR
jgi:hypothetical protein